MKFDWDKFYEILKEGGYEITTDEHGGKVINLGVRLGPNCIYYGQVYGSSQPKVDVDEDGDVRFTTLDDCGDPYDEVFFTRAEAIAAAKAILAHYGECSE